MTTASEILDRITALLWKRKDEDYNRAVDEELLKLVMREITKPEEEDDR